MRPFLDNPSKNIPIGYKVNYLTSISNTYYVVRKSSKCAYIKVICDCGNKSSVNMHKFLSGQSKSCGCMRGTHGLRGHPLYSVWNGMKNRCYNKSHKGYKHYGGRGISICHHWRTDFSAFYNWATTNGWEKRLLIDRINPNKNYTPSNCRFVTHRESVLNRTNTVFVTLGGTTKPLADWCIIVGKNYDFCHRQIVKLKKDPSTILLYKYGKKIKYTI